MSEHEYPPIGVKRLPKTIRILLIVTSAVILLLGSISLFYWVNREGFEEYTEDAYISGNHIQLMPQTSGTIITINTDDTHLVTAGQKLIQLESTDALIALQRARANLATTVREVRQYYAKVQQTQSILILRKTDLTKAQFDLDRHVGDRTISRKEMQHYRTALQSAQAQYNLALSKLASDLALVENANLYQHPLVEKAKANFRSAYLNWIRTTIFAPAQGFVAKRSAQIGQQVNPSSVLLEIIPLKEIWVDANFKETQLSRIRIGQNAKIIADANGRTYHGKVAGFTPGTGAAFALVQPLNATDHFAKVAQRLSVRIQLDEKEIEKHPLQIGLSLRVTVYTRVLPGKVLSEVTDKKPIYYTTIFNDQLAHADQEIIEILRKNSPDVNLKIVSTPTNYSYLQRTNLHGFLGTTILQEC